MEAAGLALSAAGLLAAFNSCLEALELIDLGKAHSRDITLLEQLFDNQQYRLLVWAKTHFPSVEDTDPRLHETEIRDRILNNLKCIYLLFRDRGRLEKRYGLGQVAETQNSDVVRQLPFRRLAEHFINSVKQRQGSAGLGRVSKWAIRDRRKFRELVDDLNRFITDLETITQFLGRQPDQQRMVDLEIATLSDVERNLIAEATNEYGDMVSGAAIGYQSEATIVAPGFDNKDDSTKMYLRPLPHNTVPPKDHNTISVLFADYGNSCRSPMAEAVFKRLTENLPKISTIDSAGTGNYGALCPTDKRTVTTLYRHGIGSPRRRPRQIIPADFHDFTYILAMGDSHLHALKSLDKQLQYQGSEAGSAEMRLFGSFGDVREEVDDPWGGSETDFERVYQQLVRLSDQFLRETGVLK